MVPNPHQGRGKALEGCEAGRQAWASFCGAWAPGGLPDLEQGLPFWAPVPPSLAAALANKLCYLGLCDLGSGCDPQKPSLLFHALSTELLVTLVKTAGGGRQGLEKVVAKGTLSVRMLA